jgi:hypothetical protein
MPEPAKPATAGSCLVGKDMVVLRVAWVVQSIKPDLSGKGAVMKGYARVGFIGFLCGLFGLLTTWAGQPVHAQNPLDASRKPAVSPYINILRTGSSPAINYYGIVRPEIAFRNSIFQVEGQQTALANQQQQDLAAFTTLPVTGHQSGFMTQGKYFMSSGGVGQPAVFSKGPTAAPRK